MAGYFSNHSQSNAQLTSNARSQRSGVHPTHPPASPLFSTSLANRDSEPKSVGMSPSTVHPLRNTWVFWFRQQRAPGNKVVSYEEGIKKIAPFSSVESFWSIYTHLYPPSSLVPTTDYLLFHSGIRRPVWEDPLNHTGGKWILRLRKGVVDRLWEDLVCGIVGDRFDECGRGNLTSNVDGNENEGEDWPEICGCTISVRQNEDIISVWNRVEGDPKVREKIKDTIRVILGLSPSTVMEYKSNNDSLQDKSSFRNSAIERAVIS